MKDAHACGLWTDTLLRHKPQGEFHDCISMALQDCMLHVMQDLVVELSSSGMVSIGLGVRSLSSWWIDILRLSFQEHVIEGTVTNRVGQRAYY